MAVPKLVKEKGAKKVCTMYQDDDFGLEVLEGGEAGLKTHRHGATRKRPPTSVAPPTSPRKWPSCNPSGCDMVVLGTIIRETIGTIGTARKLGYNPVFIGSSAAYTDLIHKLGGKAMDGLYATMTVQNPYTDETDPTTAVLGQQVQDQVQ